MISLVHAAVDRAAERDPDHPALRFDGATMTYGELAARSNQLAHELRAAGVDRRDRVGILVSKGFESAVAMYGTMKAGAAYVPLDPLAPAERLRFLLNDCDIRIVVTEPAKTAVLSEAATGTNVSTAIGVDACEGLRSTPWEAVSSRPPTPCPATVNELDLAYIMYTSGSTGAPKGMMHTHRSSLSYAGWGAAHCGLAPADRVVSHAPLHFDLSIFDFFSTALAGGTVVLVPEPVTLFPASFTKLLEDERATAVFTVPFSLMQIELNGELDSRNLESLRLILFGGEPYPVPRLRELMRRIPQARYCNVFGPAEAPACTHHEFTSLDEHESSLPIGVASPNNDLLIVDEEDNPVTAGVSGELLVRGPSITAGYWQRPDLNARSFLRIPQFDNYELTYFRTGDVVVEHADGLLRFLGRKDRMVKSRGYRVELDEVEAALAAHGKVREAAAFDIDSPDGTKLVFAAVVLLEGSETSENELRGAAGKLLPRYAIPVEIEVLDQFPRTTSDKVDRRRLRNLAQGRVDARSA